MNKEIKLMVEIQRLSDLISEKNKEIERYEKSINFWKDDLSQKEKNLSNLNSKSLDLQKIIKSNEIDLAEIEEHLKKLDEQKYQISSEKELNAIETELKTEKDKEDSIEEVLITKMDELDETEKTIALSKKEVEDSKEQVAKDVKGLVAKIDILKEENEKSQNAMDETLTELSPSVKAIFSKLLKSKNGIALGKVKGDACGACNFQIPSSLVTEAEDETKIAKCTNCGRFIYKVK